jgi:hypothetical protein
LIASDVNVTATLPMQRPEVEGPADRLPFRLSRRQAVDALPIVVTDDVAHIPSARLFGLSIGDEFRLLRDDEAQLGTATVAAIEHDRATLAAATGGLAGAVSALPVRTTSRRAVRVDVRAARSAALMSRIESSPLLRLADDEDVALAAISVDGGLTVSDGSGQLLTEVPFRADTEGIGQAVAFAERIAKAERLRGLASGGSREGDRGGRVAVELASHNATRTSRDRAGERLYPGERISVTITNRAEETRYVALFDIDTSFKITLLNSDEPSGWRLAPGQTKVVGGPDGVALAWDENVPRTGERLETFVVVAAAEPQQFALLETPPAAGTRGMGLSELEALLVEASTGTRSWAGSAAGGAPYRVETIDFYLVPGTRPENQA